MTVRAFLAVRTGIRAIRQQHVWRESGDYGCLSGGSGCCESVVVMSRPLALRAGRGLPTGMPSHKSVAH